MSGEKWTPGEWRAGRSEFYPGLDGPLTTRVYTDSPPNEIDVSGDNCRANAYLIAAAPTLYETLEACRAFIADQYADSKSQALDGEYVSREARPIWNAIHEAMAKARGEI